MRREYIFPLPQSSGPCGFRLPRTQGYFFSTTARLTSSTEPVQLFCNKVCISWSLLHTTAGWERLTSQAGAL